MNKENIINALARFKSTLVQDDPIFRTKLKEALLRFHDRPAAPAGKHYVRGSYEYFTENGFWTTAKFLELADSINKRVGKKRPMAVRETVRYLMEEATHNTIVHYAELDYEQKQSADKSVEQPE